MVLFIVVASAIILLAAYFTYGKFLANTVFKLDDKNPVPSVEMEDGVDYVPAKKGMLLGQHFSAIAAAGPINGPILAAVIYGWAPALLWAAFTIWAALLPPCAIRQNPLLKLCALMYRSARGFCS